MDIKNHTWNRKPINTVIFPPHFGHCELPLRHVHTSTVLIKKIYDFILLTSSVLSKLYNFATFCHILEYSLLKGFGLCLLLWWHQHCHDSMCTSKKKKKVYFFKNWMAIASQTRFENEHLLEGPHCTKLHLQRNWFITLPISSQSDSFLRLRKCLLFLWAICIRYLTQHLLVWCFYYYY